MSIGKDLVDFGLGGFVGVLVGGLVVDAAEGVEGLVGADQGEVIDGGGDGDVELLIFVVVVAAPALGGDADDLEAEAVDGDEGAERRVAEEEQVIGFRGEEDDVAVLGDIVRVEVAALGEGDGADLLDVGLDAPDGAREAAELAGLLEIAADDKGGDVADVRGAAEGDAIGEGDVVGRPPLCWPGRAGMVPASRKMISVPRVARERRWPERKPSPRPMSRSSEATPQAMPNMVRKERSLLAVIDSKTCFRISNALRMGVGLSDCGEVRAKCGAGSLFPGGSAIAGSVLKAGVPPPRASVEMTACFVAVLRPGKSLAAGEEGRVGIEEGAEGEADVGEEGLQAAEGEWVGEGGMEERKNGGGGEGGVTGEARKAEAAIRTVGAGGEIGDAEDVGGGKKEGARGCHAVDHGEDFQLGLELIGDEVDGEIGRADGIFYRRGKGQGGTVWGEVGVLELAVDGAKVGGKDVFKRDVETVREEVTGEAAAGEPGTDDGDVLQPANSFTRRGHLPVETAATTDSKLGSETLMCSEMRARSSGVSMGRTARIRRRVTAISST